MTKQIQQMEREIGHRPDRIFRRFSLGGNVTSDELILKRGTFYGFNS